MKLVTHSDRFHADDVFALAVLRIKFGDKIKEVIRTRDDEIINSADIVFDVGGLNDADTNRFDHHQPEGGGVRENGFPYASFGLIWKKWGAEICGSKEASLIVDTRLVQPVDAGDNGYSFYDYKQDGVFEYTTGSWVSSFGATWREEDNYDLAYLEAVEIAEKILNREIIQAKDKVMSIPIMQKALEERGDERILVLDDYLPWQGFLDNNKEILYVVSPSKDRKKWRVNCMQESGFINRKSFPKSWAGLRGEDLEKETGVKGSVFCHKGLFLVVGDSKEVALQLAHIALDY